MEGSIDDTFDDELTRVAWVRSASTFALLPSDLYNWHFSFKTVRALQSCCWILSIRKFSLSLSCSQLHVLKIEQSHSWRKNFVVEFAVFLSTEMAQSPFLNECLERKSVGSSFAGRSQHYVPYHNILLWTFVLCSLIVFGKSFLAGNCTSFSAWLISLHPVFLICFRLYRFARPSSRFWWWFSRLLLISFSAGATPAVVVIETLRQV